MNGVDFSGCIIRWVYRVCQIFLIVDIALHDVPTEYYVKYVYDLLITGHNKKECYQHLEIILWILEEKGIIASLTKIKEGMEIPFCGYTVSFAKDDGPITITPC